MPCDVLVGARRFADEHQIRVRIADAEDDLLAAKRVKLAAGARGTDLCLDGRENLRGGTGIRRPGPSVGSESGGVARLDAGCARPADAETRQAQNRSAGVRRPVAAYPSSSFGRRLRHVGRRTSDPDSSLFDAIQDLCREIGLQLQRHLDLAVSTDQPGGVRVRVEACVLARHVVGDDEVDLLGGKFLPRAWTRIAGLGGEADEDRARGRPACAAEIAPGCPASGPVSLSVGRPAWRSSGRRRQSPGV